MKAHLGYLGLFTLVALLALSPLLALASDVTDATYVGRVEVRKNNSIIRNATVNMTLAPGNLVNPGYVFANFTNSALIGVDGNDVAYMPAPDGSTQWMLFAPEVAENTTINNRLYTGGSTPMGGHIRWFPSTSGGNTTDAADLEPANNFSINITGFVDTTTAGSYLVSKGGDLVINITAANEVTAELPGENGWGDRHEVGVGHALGYGGATWGAQTLTTDGAHTASSISMRMYRVGSPGTLTLAIRATSAGEPVGADLSNGTINADTFTTDVAGAWYEVDVTDYDLLGATVYAIVLYAPSGSPGTDVVFPLHSSSNNYTEGIVFSSLDSGSSWTSVSTADFLFRIHTPFAVSATANPGEHSVVFTMNTTAASISVDGTQYDTITNDGTSVTDNAAPWSWATNGTMPYAQSISLSINGTEELAYDFSQYQADATVTDDGDAPANAGTIGFASTRSDADLSATFVSFEPVSTSQASASVVGADPAMWDAVPDIIPELYTELQTNHLPGAGFVNDMLGHANIPQAMFWFPVCFGSALIIGFLVYFVTRSLLMQSFCSGLVLAFCSLMTDGGIIPFWTVIVFALEALAILWTQRQRAVP